MERKSTSKIIVFTRDGEASYLYCIWKFE